MKKKNLNILAAVLVGVAVFGGVVLANGRGLMGNINQNRAATRAEVAKSLAVIVAENDNRNPFFNDYSGCFEDVEGKAYEGYVCYLIDRGIFAGFADGKFWPERLVNRAEAAKVFFDAYETAGGEVLPRPPGVPYRDVAELDWYYPSLVQIARLGIPDVMGWRNKDFRPGADLTVGQLGNWSRKLERVLR